MDTKALAEPVALCEDAAVLEVAIERVWSQCALNLYRQFVLDMNAIPSRHAAC